MLITYQIKSNSLTLKSFVESFKDRVSLIVNFGVISGLILFIYIPFFNSASNLMPLEIKWWLIIILLVFLAVLPFDILKTFNNKKKR